MNTIKLGAVVRSLLLTRIWVLMQFGNETSHSHRGFSPVMGGAFEDQETVSTVSSVPLGSWLRETVKTVRYAPGTRHHRAEAAV